MIFFGSFSQLNRDAYEEGAISRKHKELMGLALSVTTKGNKNILFHLRGCADTSCTKKEILEAIKIGLVSGSAMTYSNVRFALEIVDNMKQS